MGGSGSGKSSTLDVLAFRTKACCLVSLARTVIMHVQAANTRGLICLNERPCDAVTARSFIG